MDAEGLFDSVKRAAAAAAEAAAPCEILLGTVVDEAPLTVSTEQRVMLGEAQLIIPRRLSNYSITVEGGNVRDWFYLCQDRDTSQALDPDIPPNVPPHEHAIGEQELLVKGAPKIGDRVILIRQRGGQRFLLFDVLAKGGMV